VVAIGIWLDGLADRRALDEGGGDRNRPRRQP
jgi:hypothetical protein